MGALEIFAGLLEYLFEEDDPADVVVLHPPHLLYVVLDLTPGQQHVEAVLTHHLQDEDEVFEVSNVVNRQI